MRYFLTKFRVRLRRIGSMVLVFGGAGLVLAYFLGFYDIAFIDREALLGSIATPTPPAAVESAADTATSTAAVAETFPDTEDPFLAEEDPDGETAGATETTGATQTVQSRSVCHVVDPALLSSKVKAATSVSALSGKGYAASTQDWDDSSMKLGKMQFSYALPQVYSLTDRTVSRLTYVYPENFSAYYAQYTDVVEARPALELYMGYILYDNGKQLVLLDHDGNILQGIDDTVTIPAYERDKDGAPLFYRSSWVDGAQNKTYYRLSEDGKSFVPADYDPVTDSRGLVFDYPTTYGQTDNTALARMRKGEGDSRVGYTKNGAMLTSYKFNHAYPFRNGYAAVVGDENRQELYFLSENGQKALAGYRMYLRKDYERYVIESWQLPASLGIESIGSFYFDHGWVRVRRQIIDYYSYTAYRNVRVISDTDILIDAAGEEFPIPSGYTLRGYSCGMLLLEKDGRYGFMDYTGAWIAQPIYAAATPFVSGLATLTTPDGRVGMIDTAGDIVLPFAYDAVTPCSSGLIAAYHANNGWAVYQVMQK